MTTTISLNCWIVGEDLGYIFMVKLQATKTVRALKDAIKEKQIAFQHVAFQHVDAGALVLWKISIADEDLEEKLEQLNLDGKHSLRPWMKLSSLFADQPVDDHLHIVVKAPPTVTHQSLVSEQRPPIQLNCLVLGEDPGHIFLVELQATKTVGALKDVIKEEKQPAFDHVPANTLVLWKVSIPVDDSLEEIMRNFDGGEPLLPVEALSKVFPSSPNRKHLHIVVKLPPVDLWPRPPSLKIDPIDELMEKLTFAHLETAQNDVIQRALSAASPSSTAALNRFLREQGKHPIWNGCPSMNHDIPIQLYHPSFANFLRVAHKDTGEIELKPEDYSATYSLFLHSAAL